MGPTELGPRLLSWASVLDVETRLQAERTARLPIIHGHVALMPDAHWGNGATIGSVIPTDSAILPAAVGVDIGCGMIAVETDILEDGLPEDLDRLHGYIAKVVPAGLGKGHESARKTRRGQTLTFPPHFTQEQKEIAGRQLGSLGGGNHFVEVCVDERHRVWVVLHSGSRNIGKTLAEGHIRTAKADMKKAMIKLEDPQLAYFVQGTTEFDHYIIDMLWAQEYARLNREVMMDEVLVQFFGFVASRQGDMHIDGHEISRVNCHHNFAAQEIHDGIPLWITRKGAIRATTGDLGVIPGSMGTCTYIVRGTGNERAYNSCAHGAGRAMSRTQAKKVLDVASLSERMRGKSWNVQEAESLVDEHPDAYKDIERVMDDQRDLVTVEHRLEQVLNYKGTK